MEDLEVGRVRMEGVSLVGQPVRMFSVGGKVCTLAEAVAHIEQIHSLAIEDAVASSSVTLRQRIGKLKDLGRAMAVMAKLQANISGEDSMDKTYVSNQLQVVAQVARQYNIQLPLVGSDGSGYSITRGDATKATTILQQEINNENNNITRASNEVQNFLGARRIAFDREEGIIMKSVDSSGNIIRAMTC